MDSHHFRDVYRAQLAALEGAVTALRQDVDACYAVKPPSSGFSARAEEAASIVQRVRELLREGAIAAELPPGEWIDRDTLEAQAVSIIGRLREREAIGPLRAQLRALSAYLKDHLTIRYHVSRREQKLNDSRKAAAQELEQSAESSSPPGLPGPKEPEQWLTWVYSLSGKDLEALLDALPFPALARLIEECPPQALSSALPAQPKSPSIAESSAATPPPQAASAVPEPPPIDEFHAVPDPPPPAASTPLPPAPMMAMPMEPTPTLGASVTSPPPPQLEVLPPPVVGAPEASPHPVKSSATPTTPAAQTPSSAQPLPLPRTPALPDELRQFDRYRRGHWITPEWQCAPVPWSDRAFIDDLRAAIDEELRESASLARPWVFSRAMEQLEVPPPVRSEDLRSAADLLVRPLDPACGASTERGRRIIEILRSGAALPTEELSAWRLGLFLEAVSPSIDLPDPQHRLEPLLQEVELRGPLHRLIGALLRPTLRQGGEIPILLDKLRQSPPPTPQDLEQLVKARREEFHRTFINLYSAAGGKIERTHCRHAWRKFINSIEGIVRPLFPLGHGGQPTWNTQPLHEQLVRAGARYKEIADDGDAKFQDRTRMDDAAQRILTEAQRINDLMAQLHDSRSNQWTAASELPVSAARELLAAPLARSEERLCQRILAALVDGKPNEGASLVLGNAELQRRPILRALLTGSPPFPVAEIATPLPIAALLCAPPSEGPIPRPEQVALRVQDHLADLQSMRQQSGELGLQDLRAALKTIFEEAEAVLRTPGDGERELFLDAWLGEVLALAHGRIDDAVRDLTVRTDGLPDRRDVVLRALHERRYADAIYLLHNEPRGDSGRRPRETAYRGEAQQRFTDPAGLLRQELKRPGKARQYRDLLEIWLRHDAGDPHGTHFRLRRLFSEFVFSPKSTRHGNRTLVLLGSSLSRVTKEPFRLSCTILSEYLLGDRHPSLVPQLRDFTELVVATPDPASAPSLSAQVAEVIDRHPEAILVVLLPGLVPDQRTQVQERLRRSSHGAVALLDDLDLCRLLNPGGKPPDPLLGLLEIVLEQQRLRDVSPFQVPQGSSMRMEMFVGREDEARELARSARYTRLFSGRKFGKTALLRYLRERYDRTRLPSGCTLHILPLDLTGVDREDRVVQLLRDVMRERFKEVFAPSVSGSASPADVLEALIRLFLEQYREDSLLFLLDEADTFVSHQLRESALRHEKSLAWRMRSSLEQRKDSRGLPRVRVVFSGYRTTWTREGPWGNWGGVLALKPLPPEEAALLISGPLARIGIDAGEQAFAIAYRCGYQPAVLLRFGEVLLERLGGRADVQQSLQVKPVDVTAAFEDRRVQESIERVVWDNFEGSQRAGLVFAVLLQLFAGHPPWSGLPGAEQVVLQRLRELDAARLIYPLESDEGALGDLRLQLQILAERDLLIERQGTYYLRFPHHMDTLKRDLDGELSRRLKDLREQSTGPVVPGADEETTTFVSRGRLSELRALVVRPPDPPLRPRAVVLASHWPEALNDQRRGIIEQMEIDAAPRFWRDLDLVHQHGVLVQDRLLLQDVPSAGAQEVLAARMEQGLPPVLAGGADLLRWALCEDRDSLTFFEIVNIGRVSRSAIERWFRYARGIEFAVPGASAAIWARTSGIPLAVGLLDAALVKATGGERTTVSSDILEPVLHRLPDVLRERSAGLVEGPPSLRLAPRELDVLRMLVLLGRAGEDKQEDLRDLLTWAWQEWQPGSPIEPLDPTCWTDQLALQMVERLGLVPTTGRTYDPFGSLLPLRQDDALYALLKAVAP